MNSTNLFAHCGKLQVCPFDHPRSELHNLLRGKNPLCNKSADNHLTDPERSGGLLHGNPQPLIWWWTGRKAVCMADMLHALLRPSVAVAGAIAQPVQGRNKSTRLHRLKRAHESTRLLLGS